MRSRLALPLVLLVACSGSSSTGQPVIPRPTCDPSIPLRDVSSPTATVGDGSPGSCTAAALQVAASDGGTIVFACGPAPVTIAVASPIVVTKDAVIDGGGLVTLSGGGASRILKLDSSYDRTTPRLVVQRLSFTNGASPRTGDDTADGGAAIYRDGGSLTVIECTFDGNHAPASGQDLAGGAIYAFGGGETVIVRSTFTGNSASNGGAVGSLNGHLTVVDSAFTQNSAAGTGGNPGNGGCGGAIYQDGGHERTSLCGVTLRDNAAGALGGGVFRVSNDGTGTFAMNASTVDSNRVTPTGSGNAGGLYLQGLSLAMTNSTVSRNRAFHNGGLWIHGGSAYLVNVTVAENTAFGTNGGGLWLSNSPAGELLNCTIANNRSTAPDTVAGAIFGAGLSLRNTLVAGNTAMWSPGCDQRHAEAGGNLQWPSGALCTEGSLVTDPLLGALVENGGPTETLVPLASSPARGHARDCPPFDQRGQPRNGACTSGAVEAP
jgi:parallel beta-helix repeat protein